MKFIIKSKSKGFIVPMTLFITTIILTVVTGISIILAKEIFFGRIGRESKLAYYAADTAMSCAINIDEKYIDKDTGLGIFRYDTTTEGEVLDKINQDRNDAGLANITLNDIKCATSQVFNTDTAGSSFSVSDFTRDVGGTVESGKKSTFKLKMDLGDTTYRCASVVVNKTATYRQIIARGFSSCNLSGNQVTERAIINTSEIQ